MIRFLARMIGLLLLAAGFVGLVIDGTRSIANGVVSFSAIADLLASLFPRAYPTFEGTVTRLSPLLWDPVALALLPLPAGVFGFVAGALLLWLGQKPERRIGYLSAP